MREISEGIDIAVSTILTVCMLGIGIWCITYLNSLTANQVWEKTAPIVETNERYGDRVYSARDLLLQLVVNDELVPKPAVVNFTCGARSYTVRYDNAWFDDKEEHINQAWNQFFKYCINETHSKWTAKYNSSGDAVSWDVYIYTP